MAWLLDGVFRLWTWTFALAYGGEGLNVPLLVMPTRYLAATLRRYGARIGQRVRFRAPVIVHNSAVATRAYYRNLTVGSDCYFGRELFLDLEDRIMIEDNVTLSHRVMILTHTDAGTSPLRDHVLPSGHAPVTIRQGAYIGAGVTILQGVEIGACSLVGAGALVTRSIPAASLALGVPARVIKPLPTRPGDVG